MKAISEDIFYLYISCENHKFYISSVKEYWREIWKLFQLDAEANLLVGQMFPLN